MLEPQNEHFVRDFLQFSYFVASKSIFSYEFSHEPQKLQPQINVSCEASVNFHHICHGTHFVQHWQCDSQTPRNTTSLKCRACHAKWQWRSPKCCACHEKCNASSENDAKVHKNDFRHVMKHVGMSQSTTPATWNEAMRRLKFETSKSDRFCRTPHIGRHGHSDLIANARRRLQADADGCQRRSSVERTSSLRIRGKKRTRELKVNLHQQD